MKIKTRNNVCFVNLHIYNATFLMIVMFCFVFFLNLKDKTAGNSKIWV